MSIGKIIRTPRMPTMINRKKQTSIKLNNLAQFFPKNPVSGEFSKSSLDYVMPLQTFDI